MLRTKFWEKPRKAELSPLKDVFCEKEGGRGVYKLLATRPLASS